MVTRIHLYVAAYMTCAILLVLYRDGLPGIYMKLCTLFGICLFVALLERHKNRLQQSQNWSLIQNTRFSCTVRTAYLQEVFREYWQKWLLPLRTRWCSCLRKSQ